MSCKVTGVVKVVKASPLVACTVDELHSGHWGATSDAGCMPHFAEEAKWTTDSVVSYNSNAPYRYSIDD